MSDVEREVERSDEHQVTPLELFFDLVFVFAMTQVTAMLADDPSWGGVLRGMLVLAALWWAWTGYAWLTSATDVDEGGVRLTMLASVGAMLVAALAVPVTGAASAAAPRTLNVAKTGTTKGDGSAAKPLSTIAAALKLAQPGDTIAVAPGVYSELLKTVRAGTATAPIRITGTPGARIKGKGVKSDDRLIQIMHSNIALTGFEISDAGKLVWIQQATGVKVLGNNLHDAAGE
ncbi:MAG TPA: low temperature requirement protein A, partial [Gaiellaceae bacterium]|nr:low temperature requirement protein A [Gaiellaceae bacterium]